MKNKKNIILISFLVLVFIFFIFDKFLYKKNKIKKITYSNTKKEKNIKKEEKIEAIKETEKKEKIKKEYLIKKVARNIFDISTNEKLRFEKKEEKLENFKINGIIKNSKKSFILLENGKILSIGEKIGNYTILEIKDKTVIVLAESGLKKEIKLWEENWWKKCYTYSLL